MRTKIAIAIGLLYGAGFGYGALIEPVSVNRSVSVSGSVTNETGVTRSFSDSQQTGSVSGAVDGSDPVIVWPAAGSQHAEGSATQDSLITTDTISNSGNLDVETWVPFSGPPYGTSSAVATSIFEITFSVLNTLSYELDFSRFFFQDASRVRDVEFSFFSPLYGSMIPRVFPEFPGFSESGILLPDTYTLRMNERVFAEGDPLTDLGICNYNMELRVASVSESGSSLWMLWAGLGALAIYSRKLA